MNNEIVEQAIKIFGKVFEQHHSFLKLDHIDGDDVYLIAGADKCGDCTACQGDVVTGIKLFLKHKNPSIRVHLERVPTC